MHDPRSHLYRSIHKAVRFLLGELSAQVASTDYQRAEELAALRGRVARDFALLNAHAEHEDAFVWPLLQRHSPFVAHKLAAAHEDQHLTMPALEAQLAAIDPEADDVLVRSDAFRVAFSLYVADQLMHMADEEELAMPALYLALDDAELIALHDALVASVPPAEMQQWLFYMLPAWSMPERLQLLAALRATAPAEAFAGVLQLARQRLAAPQFAALCEQLEKPVSRAA